MMEHLKRTKSAVLGNTNELMATYIAVVGTTI